jgi:hypothetical protein
MDKELKYPKKMATKLSQPLSMYVQANAVKEKHERELAEMRRLKAQATATIQVSFTSSCLSFYAPMLFPRHVFFFKFCSTSGEFLTKTEDMCANYGSLFFQGYV